MLTPRTPPAARRVPDGRLRLLGVIRARLTLALLAMFLAIHDVSQAEAHRGWDLKLSERVCEADLIVFGLVTEAAKASTPKGFYRLSTISPDEVLKGRLRSDEREVVERSHARIGGDPPWYTEGLEVVAFLKPIPETRYYATVGRSQGRFVVVDGRVPGAKNMAAGEFVSEIKSLLGSDETCISGVPPVPF